MQRLKNQWSNKKKVACIVLSLAIIIGATSFVLVFTSSNEPVYHEDFYNFRYGTMSRSFSTRDGLAVVWVDRDTPVIIEVATGRELKRFQNRRGTVFYNVSLEQDGMVHVWRSGRIPNAGHELIDIETGNNIIRPDGLQNVREVSNGMAVVARGHELGVIDLRTGVELVPFQFLSSIRFTSDTMVEIRPHHSNVSDVAWNRGVVDIIDVTSGEELPPIHLARYGPDAAIVQSSDGLGIVELFDRSVSLIDLKTGDILIPFDEFSEILYFAYGMAAVARDDEIALIDIASGDEIIPFGRYGYYHILSENTVAVADRRAWSMRDWRRWGIVDIASGIETVPIAERCCHQIFYRDYRDGVVVVYSNHDAPAVIDATSGEEMIPSGRYDEIVLLPGGFIAIYDRDTRLWRFEKLADVL